MGQVWRVVVTHQPDEGEEVEIPGEPGHSSPARLVAGRSCGLPLQPRLPACMAAAIP